MIPYSAKHVGCGGVYSQFTSGMQREIEMRKLLTKHFADEIQNWLILPNCSDTFHFPPEFTIKLAEIPLRWGTAE